MDGNKLNLMRKNSEKEPLASYREIPETEMEEEAITRSKGKITVIPKNSSEVDGADEKMLQDDVKVNSNAKGDSVTLKEKNGDAKLDIGDVKSDLLYLDKEELMKTANDPFWIKVRWFFFILFWLSWFGMLAGAVFIIYSAPKCVEILPKTSLKWWEEGPLLEIQPDTMLDDLKTYKNSNIRGLVIDWPEDAYVPIEDNHKVIQLIEKSKETGIPIIVGLTAGISNKWFSESENKIAYDDYYIWKLAAGINDSGLPIPPNNWISRNNKPSWMYSLNRKEFYYAPEAWPQLNFRNSKVTEELINVIKSFCAKGASGIRINDASTLLVDSEFGNQPPSQSVDATKYFHNEYDFYVHSKTEDLSDLGQLLERVRLAAKNCTGDGPFMANSRIKKIESYKVSNSLVFDLPIAGVLFGSEINTSLIVNSLEYTFKAQGFSWPLWKLQEVVVPKDAFFTFETLLPGVHLIDSIKDANWNIWRLRNESAVIHGGFNYKALANNTVLAYTRSMNAPHSSILVALNPTNETVNINFVKEFEGIPHEISIFDKNLSQVQNSSLNVSLEPVSVMIASYKAA